MKDGVKTPRPEPPKPGQVGVDVPVWPIVLASIFGGAAAFIVVLRLGGLW